MCHLGINACCFAMAFCEITLGVLWGLLKAHQALVFRIGSY
jgi:hypothetical protein